MNNELWTIPILDFDTIEGNRQVTMGMIAILLSGIRDACPVDTGALKASLIAHITVSDE
jgi:hypothetical protein